MQVKRLDPLVHIDVNELVLALRLNHIVALLSEASHYAEDREFRHWCELIARCRKKSHEYATIIL